MTSFNDEINISLKSNSTGISVGEIRRLIDMELQHDSRLVVILDHNRADDSYLVALVSNLVEVATSRDFLFSSATTGAAFDISVLPDFSVRVWKQQIDSSPIFGVIPDNFTQELFQFSLGLQSDHQTSNSLRGEYEVEFADHIWVHRGKEIDAISLLGHSENKLLSNFRFFEIWREPNFAISLADVILENNLGLNLFEEFLTNDAIRMELV